MSPRMGHDRFESRCPRSAPGLSARRSPIAGGRAALAAGATLSALLASCSAPVPPSFELTFEGAGVASCEASAAQDIRLMCESTVRVRILDPRGELDLVPPVCQEITTLDIGTMEALSQLDVALENLPLGKAMVQVEVWRRDWIDAADCEITGGNEPIELAPGGQSDNLEPPVIQPAVLGRAWFEIGRDEHVRVPLTCPDLAQVNRFAAGCGLDVELSDLDRGVLLRKEPAPEEPVRSDDLMTPLRQVRRSPAAAQARNIDLESLDVQYVLIEQTASGEWRPGASEWMTLYLRDDGSAVWRAWPSSRFWESFTRSRTVCIEVNERDPGGASGWPQVSCFQVGDQAASRQRLQASYLPPEDLQCLLAAGGAALPTDGIVIGRVVEPSPQRRDEVSPAANVQVLPTPADLPREPIPRLAPIDADEPQADDVLYVSKEQTPPGPSAPACVVDDATATTPSGYFLSDASFPAHWQIATGIGEPSTEDEDGEDTDGGPSAPQIGSSEEPDRILVGGRIPDKVSIVRIQLQ